MTFEDTEVTILQKPQVFLKNITFNDGTQLHLEHNSIIVFTGANNCGKSRVLKDVEVCLNASDSSPPIVIKNADFDYLGAIDEKDFFDEHFYLDSPGRYGILGLNIISNENAWRNQWNEHRLSNGFHRLFVNRLSTEIRLTSSNALNRSNAEQSLINKLINNSLLAQKLSNYFHQAFGVDLVMNYRDSKTIPLHTGHAPDRKAFTMEREEEYYKQVAKLPMLQEQGDGMRSFASILLDMFTSEYTITMIDEPEAFLHPPQARILGKILTKNNPDNRQLLISTHSEDFLQGLLDADNENVTVIRINRVDNVNKISVLPNDEIKKLWSKSLLRYSNILSGLFHEKVIVCESDYDCLFYQAIIDAICEHKGEISSDVLFAHCGGKTRIKDVVRALKAVNVPVVAIYDFDVLNSYKNFKPIIEAFGMNGDTMLSEDMKIIMDYMNAKKGTGNNKIKKIGKADLTGNASEAYERVEEKCKTVGLFIVPVGEMECFDKTIKKEKKEWVYNVLERNNLATAVQLEEARMFVQAIID